MLTNHPLDTLAVVHQRGRQLRADAASEAVRASSKTRHVLAVALRRAADHLEPAPIARRAALR